MSSGPGPDRPKCVSSVELVNVLSRLPLEARSSSVVCSVMPVSFQIQWSLGIVSGTSAGKIRGVIVCPRALAMR